MFREAHHTLVQCSDWQCTFPTTARASSPLRFSQTRSSFACGRRNTERNGTLPDTARNDTSPDTDRRHGTHTQNVTNPPRKQNVTTLACRYLYWCNLLCNSLFFFEVFVRFCAAGLDPHLLSYYSPADTHVFEPEIRDLLGTASNFCEVVVKCPAPLSNEEVTIQLVFKKMKNG